MLDLDLLASQRAKATDKKEDQWRSLLWSASFQALSQHMSDGEIQNLLVQCASVGHLHAIIRYLETHPGATSPLATLQKAAKGAGLPLTDWIGKLAMGPGA